MSTMPHVWAATITVGGGCSLVDAITAANTDAASGGCTAGTGADTIELTTDVTLTSSNNNLFGSNGLPAIVSTITIQGNRHVIQRDPALFADGSPDDPCSGSGAKFRLFVVDALPTVGSLTLKNLTLRNGCATGPDFNSQSGGAVFINTDAVATLTQVSVLQNAAAANGGGVFNVGSLNVDHSIIAYNDAGNAGGGLLASGTVMLDTSTISSNTAGVNGGGIMIDGGEVTLTSVTIAENVAVNGYGIADFNPGMVDASGVLIANAAGENCQLSTSTVSSASPNLDSDGSCGFSGISNVDPLIGPLQDNGGPSLTHALLIGSPAVDAGVNVFCSPTDQRGIIRRNADTCDIGAYELVKQTLTVSTADDVVDAGDGQTSFREALIDANNAPGTQPFTIKFTSALNVQSINIVGSSLPALTRGNIIIDGDTDGDGAPNITLNGGALPGGSIGLLVQSSNNTIRSMILQNFPLTGIVVYHDTNVGPPVTNTLLLRNYISGGADPIIVQAGNSVSATTGTVMNTVLRRNIASGATTSGILLITTTPGSVIDETLIDNNDMFNNTAFGIFVLTTGANPGSTISNTTIQHNTVQNNGAVGIVAEAFQGQGNVISGLVIDSNDVQFNPIGVSLNGGICGAAQNTLEATVSGNFIGRNTNAGGTSGIFVGGGSNFNCDNFVSLSGAQQNQATVTISGNFLLGNAGHGIGVSGGQTKATQNSVDITIVNNGVVSSGGDGIVMVGGLGAFEGFTGPTTNNTVTATITDNAVDETRKIGLEIDGGLSGAESNTVNATVARNQLKNSRNLQGTGGILVQGGFSADTNQVNGQFTDNTVTDNQGTGVVVLGGNTAADANQVDVTFELNTVSGNQVISGTAGVTVIGGFGSSSGNQLTAHIRNANTLNNNKGHGLSASAGQDGSSNNTVMWEALGNTVEGNDGAGIVVLGGLGAFTQITGTSANNVLNATIAQNIVRRHTGSGISIQGGLASVNGRVGSVADTNQMTVTVTENTVDTSDNIGIFVAGGSVGEANTNTVNLQIENNTVCSNGARDIQIEGGFIGNQVFPPNTGAGNQVSGALTNNIVSFVSVENGVNGNMASISQTSNTDCPGDYDGDSIANALDLCPGTPAGATVDANGCASTEVDGDNDGVPVGSDNCPAVANPDQMDADSDGRGDVCDDDSDNDGVVDAADNCQQGWNPTGQTFDTDGDGVGDDCDNCPNRANTNQVDTDQNGVGDACETDSDLEEEKRIKKSRLKPIDPAVTDSDSDGLTNAQEAVLGTNPTNPDSDSDGRSDGADNCPLLANPDQSNRDVDGLGDLCDGDDDDDGKTDGTDNCPLVMNPDQKNLDMDIAGDACDPDADGDTFIAIAEGGPDCDDLSATVHPGAVEIVGNKKDDDCDDATRDQVLALRVTVSDPAANVNALTWLPTDGRTAVITAEVVGGNGAIAIPPTFTMTVTGISNLPGKYTNDESLDGSPDYEIISNTGNQLMVQSRDFGGVLVVQVRAAFSLVNGASVVLQEALTLPEDSDNDGLPDAWESQFGDLQPQEDLDRSTANTFVGDGLTNAEEYRGFVWGPPLERVEPNAVYNTTAYVPQEGEARHFRGDPLRKDLFIKFRGYGGDNPFALGTAYVDDAELDVHVADALRVPGEAHLDAVTLTNELTATYPLTNGHINKRGVRDWTWDVKGASTSGNGVSYGAPVTYQKTLDFYFADRPYTDDSGNQVLDPLTAAVVEDRNDNGAVDVVRSVSEDVNRNGVLDGDHVIVDSLTQTLTSFDVDNDGLVELPAVSEAAQIDPRFEYTKAQVLKHTISHELGHALGMTHNTDAACLMFKDSPNWSRDGCLSLDSKAQMQIHND
jgi:hypothetical protein